MSAPPLFHLTRGEAPILVSFPHSGTYVPPDIAERMTPLALTLPDTDTQPSPTNRIAVNNAAIKAWSARTASVSLRVL